MNLFDLTDHLLELLWAKLGEVSGSPAEAARSRWALYSTCKAFRDNPAIRAQWELQNHVVTDPDACAQELSLKIVGRVVRGLCLLGDFESFMDLFEALQGKERQAMRMQLESFTELQWDSWEEAEDIVMCMQELAHLAVLFPNLSSLSLSHFTLPDSLPDLTGLSLFRGLRVLQLCSCPVDDHGSTLMKQLGRMPGLRSIGLGLIPMDIHTGLDLSDLGDLSELRQLFVITEGQMDLQSLAKVAANCTRLRHLGIGCDSLEHVHGFSVGDDHDNRSISIGSWPELRTLSLLRTEPEVMSLILDALGPLRDKMPQLQHIDRLEVNLHEGEQGNLQQLCQQLAATQVPVRALVIEGPDEMNGELGDVAPGELLQWMGQLAGGLRVLDMQSHPWSCDDVRAVAEAAQQLKELHAREVDAEVVGEVVRGLASLSHLCLHVDTSVWEGRSALLSLCAAAQAQVLASGRQQRLTLRVHLEDEDLEEMQKEWEAKCEGPQLVFIEAGLV